MVENPARPGKFLYAEDVPANGYKTYGVQGPRREVSLSVSDGAAAEGRTGLQDGKLSLETPFYRVTFDLRRGGIASLVEKKTGRELVDRKSPYALGQFLHERFGNSQMADFTGPTPAGAITSPAAAYPTMPRMLP